jgi:hypothetical protein
LAVGPVPRGCQASRQSTGLRHAVAGSVPVISPLFLPPWSSLPGARCEQADEHKIADMVAKAGRLAREGLKVSQSAVDLGGDPNTFLEISGSVIELPEKADDCLLTRLARFVHSGDSSHECLILRPRWTTAVFSGGSRLDQKKVSGSSKPPLPMYSTVRRFG